MPKRAISTDVILSGGNQGRFTKQAIEQRKAAEKASQTGLPITEFPETRKDPVAHAEFQRVITLLKAVGKDDALFESVINEYSQLASDIDRMVKLRRTIEADESIGVAELYRQVVILDSQIFKKRQRRFMIERESGFTVASARACYAPKRDAVTNPLLEALTDSQ